MTRAIKLTETGTNPNCENIRGSSGEIGCYQHLIPTFKAQSIQVLGYSTEMTQVAVEYVTTLTIQKLLESKTPEQIALQWNAGNAKRCGSGVNKYNTPFNSCEYVQKVLNNLNK